MRGGMDVLIRTVSDAAFAAIGMDPGARAEHIAPEQYVALSNFLLQNRA